MTILTIFLMLLDPVASTRLAAGAVDARMEVELLNDGPVTFVLEEDRTPS